MTRQLAALLTAGLVLVLSGSAEALDYSVGPAGINADVLHGAPISLTGSGAKVGVLGGQIDPQHPNLHVGGNGGSGQPIAEATQVAGVINSDHPVYTGAAPGSSVYGYAVSAWVDAFDAANWLTRPAQGATIVVYPFGWELGGDALDGDSWETRHIDFLAQDRDVLFTVFGNMDLGGQDFPLPTDNYNGLTVNATVMTASGRYDQVASWNNFSLAPDNGRRKPDLAAPGGYDDWPERSPESIYTTNLGGGFINNSATSLAAAHVAGTAALLTQYGQQHGLSTHHNVLRSVLVNSADKTVRDRQGKDWLQSEAYTNEVIPLDDQLGAGQVDAAAAFEQYRAGEHGPGNVPLKGWDLNTITDQGTEIQYRLSEPLAKGSHLAATLTWDRRLVLLDDEDRDGELDITGTDTLQGFAMDNLDINLYDASGTRVGGSRSTVDNVEHLYWPVPSDGMYYLGVEFHQQNDQPSVQYALAWSATAAVPEPGSLVLLASGALAGLLLWRRRRAGK